VNPYQRLIRYLGTKRWFAVFGRYILTPIDKLARSRNHSLTTLGTDFPLGYLTTTGRHSGEPRTVPLLFVTHARAAAVVGTNFGGTKHPDWVLNLEANPKALWEVQEEGRVKARPATDLEHMSLWPQFVTIWPGYTGYVAWSGRRPKMFILEPRHA